MDGSSRARTTGLSCAFLGVTDVLAGRDQCAARTGGIVHEVLLCARLAPVGPGPGQRFLARACGAIPREHAEPGHEEDAAEEPGAPDSPCTDDALGNILIAPRRRVAAANHCAGTKSDSGK